jgi:hypothetical protein
LTDIQILEHSCAEKCDVSRANVNRSPDMGDISQMFEEKSRRGDSGVKENVEWLIGKVENKMDVRFSKPMLDMEVSW